MSLRLALLAAVALAAAAPVTSAFAANAHTKHSVRTATSNRANADRNDNWTVHFWEKQRENGR
jgi:hypothetical protein